MRGFDMSTEHQIVPKKRAKKKPKPGAPRKPRGFQDWSGHRFNRLVAIRLLGRRNGQTYWECQCDCGNIVEVRIGHVRRGDSRSCGCLKRDLLRARKLTHGKKGTRAYNSWSHMKQRCINPKNRKYPIYGGRGIQVCERWSFSFENFFVDMGNPPPGMSLDRINVNGNYEPSNCRWATPKEQTDNRRPLKGRVTA